MEQITDILHTGDFLPQTNRKCQTVQDLLKELNLDGKVFVVLVNGKKGRINDVINEGEEIVIFPKIAGG